MDKNVTDLQKDNELLHMVTDVVAAYVSHNNLDSEDIPSVIRKVHSTLTDLKGNGEAGTTRQKPAVPIKKSITPDHIICLEDGKKLKMLKRYLRTHYNMSPEEYRAKWGLPANYPMVAPNYAEERSKFAKKIGLGKSPKGRGKKSKAA